MYRHISLDRVKERVVCQEEELTRGDLGPNFDWIVENQTVEQQDELHVTRTAALVLAITRSAVKKIEILLDHSEFAHEDPNLYQIEPLDGNHRLLAAKYLHERHDMDVDVEIICDVCG